MELLWKQKNSSESKAIITKRKWEGSAYIEREIMGGIRAVLGRTEWDEKCPTVSI